MITLYPEHIPPHPHHPKASQFLVKEHPIIGKALTALDSWKRGAFMARFDGVTSQQVLQHTLQKSISVHILDLFFIGMLAHSCNPNVMLDMDQQQMWSIRDIKPGDVLSMDYASTEDILFNCFPCGCGEPNCRGVVSGRKQDPLYMQRVAQECA